MFKYVNKGTLHEKSLNINENNLKKVAHHPLQKPI